jgi:hypothetical protein
VGKKAGLKVVNAGKERFGKKARSFPLPVDVGGCVGRNLAGGGGRMLRRRHETFQSLTVESSRRLQGRGTNS